MGCSPAPSCQVPTNYIVPFKADPDVAGIGVLLAFLIPAYLAFLVAMLSYITGHIGTDWLSFVDVSFLSFRKGFPVHSAFDNTRYPHVPDPLIDRLEDRRAWFPVRKDALDDALLVLRDLQLFTGLFMLVVAFKEHCEIIQYHYEIVLDLAWIASAVCVGTDFTINPSRFENRVYKYSRFVGIMALLAALIGGNVRTWKASFLPHSRHWSYAMGLPMECAWSPGGKWNHDVLPKLDVVSVMWTMMYEIFVYFPDLREVTPLPQIVRAFEWCLWLPSRVHIWSTNRISEVRKHSEDTASSSQKSPDKQPRPLGHKGMDMLVLILLYPLGWITFLCTALTLAIWESLRSELFDLSIFIFMLVYATIDIKWCREQASSRGRIGDEDEWGFGQMLPMLLLFLPIITMVEIRFETPRGQAGKQSAGDVGASASNALSAVRPRTTSARHVDSRKQRRGANAGVGVGRLVRPNQSDIQNKQRDRKRATVDPRDQILRSKIGQAVVLRLFPIIDACVTIFLAVVSASW